MKRTSIENGGYLYSGETEEDYKLIRNTTIAQFVEAGVIVSKLTHQSLAVFGAYGEVTDKFMTDRGLKVNIENSQV